MRHHIKKLVSIIIVLSFALNTSAFASEQTPMELSNPSAKIFDLTITDNPTRPRPYFWAQLGSFIFPGLSQWSEGQYAQAAFYTGMGLTGVALQAVASEQPQQARFRYEHQSLSGQLYATAGAFSAYSSFRSAVRTRQPEGKFAFLKHEESADDVLVAPFRFSYLKRPSTYIPLALATGLVVAVSLNADESWALSGEEAAYGTGTSFFAGTWEEALFRGWLMPVQMEVFGSEFWSNTSTAVIFAALHISDRNKFAIPQLIIGWHLGRTVQRDGWRIGEATFLHFWYDVIVINGISYALNGRNGSVHIPAMTIPF